MLQLSGHRLRQLRQLHTRRLLVSQRFRRLRLRHAWFLKSNKVCGGLTALNTLRPIRTAETCSCDTGFIGPNCNVCTNNNVCSSIPGTAIGANVVCNQKPVIWSTQHHTSCGVSNPLLSAAFPGLVEITVKRDIVVGTGLASLWYLNIEQFSCQFNTCTQNFDAAAGYWQCTSIECKCIPGTKFCGGGLIDLTGPINSAAGSTSIACPNRNNASCIIKFNFLSSFFPDGLELNQCQFGECSNPLNEPGYNPYLTSNRLNDAAYAGISIVLLITTSLIAFGIFAMLDFLNKRKIPPPLERIGEIITFDHVCYNINSMKILKDICGSVHPGEVFIIQHRCLR